MHRFYGQNIEVYIRVIRQTVAQRIYFMIRFRLFFIKEMAGVETRCAESSREEMGIFVSDG